MRRCAACRSAPHHVTKAALSHFSFSSRYFYNKTIVPRFFGFMRRNLGTRRWLFSTPHYSSDCICKNRRAHNRDAQAGNCLFSSAAALLMPLTRALFSDDDERERSQNSPLFCRVEGERQIFWFLNPAAAIVVSNANLFQRIMRLTRIKNCVRSRNKKVLTNDDFYKDTFFKENSTWKIYH